jgi:hypothetical protein
MKQLRWTRNYQYEAKEKLMCNSKAEMLKKSLPSRRDDQTGETTSRDQQGKHKSDARQAQVCLQAASISSKPNPNCIVTTCIVGDIAIPGIIECSARHPSRACIVPAKPHQGHRPPPTRFQSIYPAPNPPQLAAHATDSSSYPQVGYSNKLNTSSLSETCLAPRR